MKANEAPENNKRKAPDKIYACFGVFGLIQATEIRATSKDIEYTRTGAFIKKALKFLDGCIPDYMELKHANVDTFMDIDNERFIEDFKNYMKGE